MEATLPRDIGAVLLFNRYCGFDARKLLLLLNELVAAHDLNFRWLPSEETRNEVRFSCTAFGVRIVHSDQPLSPALFEPTLGSGYTELMFPDAGAAIAEHRAHVAITIGPSAGDDGDLPEAETRGLDGGFDAALFGLVVKLLKSLIMIYISDTRPLAIHWQQCDKLLTLHQFAEFALVENDVPLLVHPRLRSVTRNSKTFNGFRTQGASSLIGREISFEPCPIPSERLIERMIQFILKVRETGLMIPDGDTFGVDAHEVIRVHHAGDDDAGFDGDGDAGDVRLSYERCDEHGFHLAAGEDEREATPEIDPDDPTERALQQRIEEMKSRSAAVPEDAPVMAETDPEESVPVEPWQGVRKRADMAALRALTRTAEDRDPAVSEVHGNQDDVLVFEDSDPVPAAEVSLADHPVSNPAEDAGGHDEGRSGEEQPLQAPTGLLGRMKRLIYK